MFLLSFEEDDGKVVVYHLSFNICFSAITQSMMRESKKRKMKSEDKKDEYD